MLTKAVNQAEGRLAAAEMDASHALQIQRPRILTRISG